MAGGDGLGGLFLLMVGGVLLMFVAMIGLGWLLGWSLARMVGAPPPQRNGALVG